MCYEIEWFDEAKTIVYASFPPDTTWEDYLDCGIAFQRFARQQPNELVFLLVDIREAPFHIPSNLFTELRHFVNDGKVHIPNWGMTIIIDEVSHYSLLSSILFFLNIFTNKFASATDLNGAIQLVDSRKNIAQQVVYY